MNEENTAVIAEGEDTMSISDVLHEEFIEVEEVDKYDFKSEDIIFDNIQNRFARIKVNCGYRGDSDHAEVYIKYLDRTQRWRQVNEIRHVTLEEKETMLAEEEEARKEELKKLNESIEKNKKNVDEMKESLEAIFPNNWEIFEKQYEGSYSLILIIKFPKITIKNGKGHSRIIHDLYVKLLFDEKLNIQENMQGRRGALTYSEINSGYAHSHLPSRSFHDEEVYGVCSWRDFCLGSSELSTIQNEWKVDRDSVVGDDFNIIHFELYMYQIDAYVRWESLGGGPHIRMDSIRDKEQATVISEYVLNQQYDIILPLLKDVTINFNKLENRFIVDRLALEQKLTTLKVGELIQKTSSGEYIYNNKEGLESILQNIIRYNELLSEGIEDGDNDYVFKDKPSPTYVLDYNLTEEEKSNAEVVIHPDYTKYIANRLERDINNYFIKKYGK
jgi:hypothetical protein